MLSWSLSLKSWGSGMPSREEIWKTKRLGTRLLEKIQGAQTKEDVILLYREAVHSKGMLKNIHWAEVNYSLVAKFGFGGLEEIKRKVWEK